MARTSPGLLAITLLSACTFDPVLATLPIADAGAEAKPDAQEALDAGIEADSGIVSFPDAEEPADAEEVIDTGVEPDDSGEPPDAGENADAEPALPMIPHLSPTDQIFGSGDVTFNEGFLNTTRLEAPDPLPMGASFVEVAQSPSGPALAVLRVGALNIPSGQRVRVVGSRPLVIVASGEVTIDGQLDASGLAEIPGAGAATSGPGIGGDGSSLGTYGDTGGGGGGYGSAGAAGGFAENMMTIRGAAGDECGDQQLSVLIGGSGGGRGGDGTCTPADGGGGGGAIQIYSTERIVIATSGFVGAGGGGGRGGIECMTLNAGAGSGGGSGGAIYLIAPVIENRGSIAANGGGGGGGGSSTQTPPGNGDPGGNGGDDASAANGGAAGGTYGRRGGDGAARADVAEEGDGVTQTGGSGGNAGGGGGGVGRIVIVSLPFSYTNTGTVTPNAYAISY